MGMFDTVYFECPHCGKENSIQTKAGPCELNDWNIHQAPLEVLLDIQKWYSIYKCKHCEQRIHIKIQTMHMVHLV